MDNLLQTTPWSSSGYFIVLILRLKVHALSFARCWFSFKLCISIFLFNLFISNLIKNSKIRKNWLLCLISDNI